MEDKDVLLLWKILAQLLSPGSNTRPNMGEVQSRVSLTSTPYRITVSVRRCSHDRQ